MESAEKSIGYQKSTRAKKPWVTEAMIVKMNERRKFKNLNTVEGRESYRRMNNELRRETDKARESWWMSECEELEEMDRRGRSVRGSNPALTTKSLTTPFSKVFKFANFSPDASIYRLNGYKIQFNLI